MKYFIPFFAVLFLMTGFAFRNPGLNTQNECIKCHSAIIDNKVVHPLLESGCDYCHESTGEEHPGEKQGFKTSSSYPSLCYTCHDDKNSKSHVHTAVADGDCSVCHSPHSSPNRSLILEGFSDNICLDCHTIETETAKVVHGPVMKGQCLDCHDPHQSEYPNALKLAPNELCLYCHNKTITNRGREISSIQQHIKKGNSVHEVISTGECIICHTPHTGNFPDLLVANYPENNYAEAKVESFDLCFMCHDSELMTTETTESGTGFRNGKKNLHYLHVNGSMGRNCSLCHDPHGAPGQHMLKEYVMFGKWKMPLGLELNENGGSCATGCHKRKEYSRI